MIVGNIIIPYQKIVERLGLPKDGIWEISGIEMFNNNTEIPIEKNKVWAVRGSNRDDLISLGAMFQKSERIIF